MITDDTLMKNEGPSVSLLLDLAAQRCQHLARAGAQVERSRRGLPAAHRHPGDTEQRGELGDREPAPFAQCGDVPLEASELR